MLRLFNFLSANRNAILFIALELIAFNLIVRTNEVQQHKMGDALLEVSGEVQQVRGGIMEYFLLEQKNALLISADSTRQQELDQLRAEVIRLRGQLEQQNVDSAFTDSLVIQADTFRFIPARVLRNSTHKKYNYLTLDLGTEQGVEVGQGVIGPGGLIGKVIKASSDYSLVQSAINLDFRVPVRVRKGPENTRDNYPAGGFLGFFKWTSDGISEAYVTNLPENSAGFIQNKDLVVTAGSSTIFPEGIRVGELINEGNPERRDGVINYQIRLAVDFSTLNHVFVVESPLKAQLDSLEVDLPQE